MTTFQFPLQSPREMWPFFWYSVLFWSSRSTIDLLTVVSHRITRAFKRSGATWAMALDSPRLLTGFGMLVFFTESSLKEFQVRYLFLFLLFSVIDGFVWFWMESLNKNIQLMLEFLKAPFLVLRFSHYTLMTILTMLSVILLSMLMILLSLLSVTTWIDFWTVIWSKRHCGLG